MDWRVTAGLSVIAGAALLEVALLPAVLVGGAALLAPNFLPKSRRRPPIDASPTCKRAKPVNSRPIEVELVTTVTAPPKFAVKKALAKTITFRVIVTTLDFTTNFLVIGDLATAAGLSTFSLVVGPLFYFGHETAWNYFGPPSGAAVELSALSPLRRHATTLPVDRRRVVVSRALAKTVTFRTIATVMDFGTNFVVIGDLATAAALSAFGFVLGPFVYLGHEAAWDYFTSTEERPIALPAAPAPALAIAR